MNKTRASWRTIIGPRLWAVCFMAVCGLLASGFTNRPWPDFPVVSTAGQSKSSRQLSTRNKWLLIYVEPDCRPCEAALKVLDQDPALSNPAQKVIVVVGGRNAAETQRFAQQFAWLPEASWFADANRQSATALGRRGAPIIYGIQDNQIAWSVSGSLADANKLAALMRPWIQD